MSNTLGHYLTATRHPWSSLIFILPFLVAYEAGFYFMAVPSPEPMRNGADAWMRATLDTLGLPGRSSVPLLLLLFLLCWTWWRRKDRPRDLLGLWIGMACESALFALALFFLSQTFGPFLGELDNLLQQGSPYGGFDERLAQFVSFLGAGIYEETLFRLLLFSGLLWTFSQAEMPVHAGVALAAAASALLFASAHHLGPHGEPFNGYAFIFRSLAGVYFAYLFHMRGLGIAVGAHAGYDILAGILVRL